MEEEHENDRSKHDRLALLVYRFLTPLGIAIFLVVFWFEKGNVDTFVFTLWVGFFVHAFGWLWAPKRFLSNAVDFLPMFFFYGGISAYCETQRAGTNLGIAAFAYLTYLGLILWTYNMLPEDENEGDA